MPQHPGPQLPQRDCVLIVEDDEGLRSLIARRLRSEGFACSGVGRGAEAIAQLQQADPRPTMMILDYQLGDMTGADLIQALDQAQCTVPFIVTTGYGDERLAVEMMKRGARDYLVKDRSLLELLPSVVRRLAGELARERKLAEAEARQQRLEEQIAHAQKLKSLGVLAGGIAHDFNNLLVGILGNTELLLLELPPDSTAGATLREIRLAAKRAADLCKQMLAYSGKGNLLSEPFSLSDLVAEMAQLITSAISKRVQLSCQLGRDLPPVQGDATQMRQLVMNLIINASDALGEQSGVIRIATEQLVLEGARLQANRAGGELAPGTYVVLEVADTGCGMDDETLRRLFEPFFSTKFTGRGLGLSAVLGIVRSHAGAIEVESSLGAGTTFRVLLPAQSKTEILSAGRAAGGKAAEWRGAGTVLLVDDEAIVLGVGKRMLERLGFAVVTARNGREAVETFRSRPGEWAAVILDLTMPEMGGQEALRQLRVLDSETPVLLSSGYSDAADASGGIEVAGYLQKPYTLQDMTQQLRRILG